MKKVYKIVMMSKHEIRIDPEELPKVLKAIASNSPAILKQGIFNPSSYSHIIEDTERGIKEKEIDELNHYTGRITLKYESLPDIFEGIEELARLKSVDVKRLN